MSLLYFQVAVGLLHTYQDLKTLGHPDYQHLEKHFRSTLTDDALENEVRVTLVTQTDNKGIMGTEHTIGK